MEPKLDPDLRGRLDAAFRATIYRIDAPTGAIDIRIGVTHPDLDALLLAAHARQWAYVSAANPRSAAASAAENLARHARLIDELRSTGRYFLEGRGIPDEGEWPPEASAWIAGITREDAAQLGRRLDQNALVFGLQGGAAELVWLR